MKIITGYTGTPHVTSNAVQGFNQGIFGTENYVLNVGSKFNATMTDAVTATIEDGEGVLQGVHFRVDPGMTESVTISPGSSGYNRIDLICARYTKEPVTGIENVKWAVITGTPSASTPTAPAYNEGSVLAGDSPVDFPMFKVTLTGVTPVISQLFEVSRGGNIMWYPGEIHFSGSASGSTEKVSDESLTLKAGHMYGLHIEGSADAPSQQSAGTNMGFYAVYDIATNNILCGLTLYAPESNIDKWNIVDVSSDTVVKLETSGSLSTPSRDYDITLYVLQLC